MISFGCFMFVASYRWGGWGDEGGRYSDFPEPEGGSQRIISFHSAKVGEEILIIFEEHSGDEISSEIDDAFNISLIGLLYDIVK